MSGRDAFRITRTGTDDRAAAARAISQTRDSLGTIARAHLLVPGVFFFPGVSNPAKRTVGMPHTAADVADARAIQIGARAMAAVILERLRR